MVTLVAILSEWTYVIIWTRRFGKALVARVFNAVSNLRKGRGTALTPVESIAGGAPTEEGGDRLDELINRASEQFGVSRDDIAALAEQYVGGGGAAPNIPTGILGRLRGAVRPQEEGVNAQDAILAQIFQGVMQGNVSIEDALVGVAPYLMKWFRGGGQSAQTGQSGQGSQPGYYW